MKKGKLPENNLVKSVLKSIKKINPDVQGLKIGSDYGIIGDFVTADGVSDDPKIAWIKAMNNFSVSMANPLGARVVMELSENCKDSMLKKYAEIFSELSEKNKVQIAGGNTETVEGLAQSRFVVTFFGLKSERLFDRKNVKEDCDIVMAGTAGACGTNILVRDFSDRLTDRFSASYLNTAVNDDSRLDISSLVYITKESGFDPLFMHDISSGGVYRALCELGEWTGKGFLVENRLIPIKQETIEICDFLDINPYMIDGTGGVLIIVKRGRDLVSKLLREGYEAAIIGKITGDGLRQVSLAKDELRTLSPSDGDELDRMREMKRG